MLKVDSFLNDLFFDLRRYYTGLTNLWVDRWIGKADDGMIREAVRGLSKERLSYLPTYLPVKPSWSTQVRYAHRIFLGHAVGR